MSLDEKWEVSHTAVMMTPTELVKRADAYCEARGIASTTLSRQILGDWKGLDLIRDGKRNIQFATLEKAFERLSALEAELRNAA